MESLVLASRRSPLERVRRDYQRAFSEASLLSFSEARTVERDANPARRDFFVQQKM